MRKRRGTRPRRDVVRPLAVAAVMAGSACGDTPEPIVCTDEFVYGLIVDVHEGSGGPGTEGAVGVAIDGSFADTLQSFDSVRMVGAGERSGTYDVTIEKDGFATWSTANITVTADECHVTPVRLDAVLIPVLTLSAVDD
ncbi:MAG: carboxypeptidase-like regulatory domain-containing protein [Gemmatimonadetes bacterium]|nr:carboxypeptidase-like regulatory domain-containing protein [Gemmatimonadota bacterium]